MRHLNGPLQRLSGNDARRRIDEPGTNFVAEIQPGWRLYKLADGTGLLTIPDLVATDNPAVEHGVRMVIGIGELWDSPESVFASLPGTQRPTTARASHVLEGIFDASDLVTTGLEAQRLHLDRVLGFPASPPLTVEGLGEYDEFLPEDPEDYDVPLIRAAACVLSETVRAGAGGVFKMERKKIPNGSVWEPWIQIAGGGDRLIPAADYVTAMKEGEVPTLQEIYWLNVS